jgi:hypothetical protein
VHATGSDTGTKAIAEEIACEPGLPVNELEISLRAVWDALAAPLTFRVVNTEDPPPLGQ